MSDVRPNPERRPNRLAEETSPYLLQHAYNPVDWHPWGDEALDKASRENKLLLVSIGYSACHWCHVMERESFEDVETAALMNERFVCVKVDREERPDVDQVYMEAVQRLTGHGGWPLNCFALPDGRPVHGGTYFRKEDWRELLRTLSDLYARERDKVEKHSEQLARGLRSESWPAPAGPAQDFTRAELESAYRSWQAHFDPVEGGTNHAPKFPMPNNYLFLLRYGTVLGDESALRQLRLTLDKMAYGGIYDHIGGGFARYSTDAMWKVPHFEKMLYDNAQLLELYAEAFRATGDPLYAKVARETATFVARELTSPAGAFYSALDADSEGEEGKYYVWAKAELESILGGDFPLFRDYYNVNSVGYWEDGNYIPLRNKTSAQSAREAGLSEAELERRIEDSKALLLSAREKRVRPGLDDKILTSWNALMAKGYLAAYQALDDPAYLQAAARGLDLLLRTARRPDGGLFHACKAGRASANGFLEDYAFTAAALISLYQATFEEKRLEAARELAEYAVKHFRDPVSGLFYFTSDLDKPLAARKIEIADNVIPSSNSTLAKVLFDLSVYYGLDAYRDMAAGMLDRFRGEMQTYPSGFSNWAMLMLNFAAPFSEWVLAGPGAAVAGKELAGHYLPNSLVAGAVAPGSLPILQGRFDPARTRIYVCRNRVCGLPVATVSEALAQSASV